MLTIGLMGGMSWESSLEYYRIINQYTAEKLGGLHSAKSVMVSLDFAAIEALQMKDDWGGAAEMLTAAGRQLERGGADFLVICTNTMHLLADRVQAEVDIPLLHIADATARNIKEAGLGTVGLLGTRFTMEKDFYRGRLEEKHQLDVLTPEESGKDIVHRVIYDQLVQGVIEDSSRRKYLTIIANLVDRGAEVIILGCTEIGLLVKQKDLTTPVFDTAAIHAHAAVEVALEEVPLP